MKGTFKYFIFNLPMTFNEDNPMHSELVALSMQTGPADLVSLAYTLHRGTMSLVLGSRPCCFF